MSISNAQASLVTLSFPSSQEWQRLLALAKPLGEVSKAAGPGPRGIYRGEINHCWGYHEDIIGFVTKQSNLILYIYIHNNNDNNNNI